MSTKKMHRVVLYVMELNDKYSPDQLKILFEQMRYPEFVHVGEIKTADIGEWKDEHPLNLPGGDYESYFKEVY